MSSASADSSYLTLSAFLCVENICSYMQSNDDKFVSFSSALLSLRVSREVGSVGGMQIRNLSNNPLSFATIRGMMLLRKASGWVKQDRAKAAEDTPILLLELPLVSYQCEPS